jgi:hypothetical protein
MSNNTLIEEIKSRFNHNESKLYLSEKYNNKLVISINGGIWRIDSNLISMLHSFDTEYLVLLDINNNPVKINRLEMLDKVKNIYLSVMDDWINEYNILKRNR